MSFYFDLIGIPSTRILAGHNFRPSFRQPRIEINLVEEKGSCERKGEKRATKKVGGRYRSKKRQTETKEAIRAIRLSL